MVVRSAKRGMYRRVRSWRERCALDLRNFEQSLTNAQVVHIDAKPSVRKQILRELQIMHDCVRSSSLR